MPGLGFNHILDGTSHIDLSEPHTMHRRSIFNTIDCHLGDIGDIAKGGVGTLGYL